MTNKINGIDVSECDYFEKQHIEDMYESDDCNVCIDNFCALCWKECEKYNGCYFKQLKRLQQENEELKEKIKDLDAMTGIFSVRLADKYKLALEEIRELAEVNSLNTCWTILNNCNDCHNNNECGEQSPIAKLKFIKDKVNEALNDR